MTWIIIITNVRKTDSSVVVFLLCEGPLARISINPQQWLNEIDACKVIYLLTLFLQDGSVVVIDFKMILIFLDKGYVDF